MTEVELQNLILKLFTFLELLLIELIFKTN